MKQSDVAWHRCQLSALPPQRDTPDSWSTFITRGITFPEASMALRRKRQEDIATI
ncbi:MAG TPA: hypothetical protein VHW24_03490 [Bryobacteraceae bacterium]|nr:hypothetical protein [Bryobacteraceae bacterium]